MHPDPNGVWFAGMVFVGLLGYAIGWMSKSQFRRGCVECAAVERREFDRRKEDAHDMAHRGILRGPDQQDIYDCSDINCPRNKRNIPPPPFQK